MKRLYGDLEIRDGSVLKLSDNDSSAGVSLKSPATLSADYTLTLPADDGASGQLLSTDGSGVLSWVSALSAALNSQNVFIGNGSNVATPTDTNSVGDILANSTTGLTIKAGVIVDADINATAAITLSKLAAVTASRALASDGSGFIVSTAVTATELGYVTGVTSAIQTQLDAKVGDGFAQDWDNSDGDTLVVTHNLGTKDVIVQLYDMDDDATIEVDSVVRTDNNTVTLSASSAPATSWRVLIGRIN